LKIAMWSGPRNLSTAMMYSFAARGDCTVVDEPFYAAYLAQTGLIHPMQSEILASQSSDPAQVAATLTGPNPADKPHFYQKHMTHHMLPGMALDWMAGCENVFLIRHPARVIASYARKRQGPTLDDIGFPQQAALFEHESQRLGHAPIVIDSYDIRANPGTMLEKLCTALGLTYTDKMLRWPLGGNADDGIWAAHWYGAVHRSTGFEEAEGALPDIPAEYQDLLNAALPFYDQMTAFKLS
jgi:hypothetical protein